jgi:hypothetical protein
MDSGCIVQDGVTTTIKLTSETDPRYECVYCHYICYLSAVICRCAASRRKVACLRHSRLLCSCPTSQKLLVYWYTLDELRSLQVSCVVIIAYERRLLV